MQSLVDKRDVIRRTNLNEQIIQDFINEIKAFNKSRQKSISEAKYSIVEHRIK